MNKIDSINKSFAGHQGLAWASSAYSCKIMSAKGIGRLQYRKMMMAIDMLQV